MDALTSEIVHYLETLPLAKKQAVLELVKPAENSAVQPDSWQKRWLEAPVMTEEEERNIVAIHNELNEWTIKS